MSIKKILIVDDSATDREVLSTVLLHHGFRVITAADGQQAIDFACTEFPDLILMDIVMPRVNGFQATRTLGRNPLTNHIPIIMCSNLHQEADRVWGLRQGAHAYLEKPIKPKQLLDIIAALGTQVSS
jgi:twitching motility two-component system response regulator PilH